MMTASAVNDILCMGVDAMSGKVIAANLLNNRIKTMKIHIFAKNPGQWTG